MNIHSDVDPFNLARLTEDIDRGFLRILMREFPSVVSEEALSNIRVKIRDEVRTLISEMLSDIQNLNTLPAVGGFLKPDERIQTVKQMAEQLATVFDISTASDEKEDTKSIAYWQGRAKWIFFIWLQVYGNLMQRVGNSEAVVGETTFQFEGGDEHIRVPLPSQIDNMYNIWQLTRRLTLEYLQAKAELLIASGENVPHIQITHDDAKERGTIELSKAFWGNNPQGSLMILHSLRSVLLSVLQLDNRELPIDLRLLPTNQLILLAHESGIQLPFALEVLGNLTYDLEGSYYHCRPIPVHILYPIYRIMDETITYLSNLKPSEEVAERALAILSQNA